MERQFFILLILLIVQATMRLTVGLIALTGKKFPIVRSDSKESVIWSFIFRCLWLAYISYLLAHFFHITGAR